MSHFLILHFIVHTEQGLLCGKLSHRPDFSINFSLFFLSALNSNCMRSNLMKNIPNFIFNFWFSWNIFSSDSIFFYNLKKNILNVSPSSPQSDSIFVSHSKKIPSFLAVASARSFIIFKIREEIQVSKEQLWCWNTALKIEIYLVIQGGFFYCSALKMTK